MTTLSDLIGADTQPWMSTPGRNCDTGGMDAREIRKHADVWIPTGRNEIPETAATLCAGCPAAAMCLEFAMARPELEGVWGGSTTKQRVKARRKAAETRARAEKKTAA